MRHTHNACHIIYNDLLVLLSYLSVLVGRFRPSFARAASRSAASLPAAHSAAAALSCSARRHSHRTSARGHNNNEEEESSWRQVELNEAERRSAHFESTRRTSRASLSLSLARSSCRPALVSTQSSSDATATATQILPAMRLLQQATSSLTECL